jgi:hypothetical protein
MADFRAFLRNFKDDENTVRLPRQGTNQPRFAPFHHEKTRYGLIFTTVLLLSLEPQYDKKCPESQVPLSA